MSKLPAKSKLLDLPSKSKKKELPLAFLTNASVKFLEDVLYAYDKMGEPEGLKGRDYLAKLAQEEPKWFLETFASKGLLPKNISFEVKDDSSKNHTTKILVLPSVKSLQEEKIVEVSGEIED